MTTLAGPAAKRALCVAVRVRQLWEMMTSTPLRAQIEQELGVSLDGDPGIICGIAASASFDCVDRDEAAGFVATHLERYSDLGAESGESFVAMIERKCGTATSMHLLLAMVLLALGHAETVFIYSCFYQGNIPCLWIEVDSGSDREEAMDIFWPGAELEFYPPGKQPIILALGA